MAFSYYYEMNVSLNRIDRFLAMADAPSITHDDTTLGISCSSLSLTFALNRYANRSVHFVFGSILFSLFFFFLSNELTQRFLFTFAQA